MSDRDANRPKPLGIDPGPPDGPARDPGPPAQPPVLGDPPPPPDERPPEEVQAEADLLKTSGGDPLTQESD